MFLVHYVERAAGLEGLEVGFAMTEKISSTKSELPFSKIVSGVWIGVMKASISCQVGFSSAPRSACLFSIHSSFSAIVSSIFSDTWWTSLFPEVGLDWAAPNSFLIVSPFSVSAGEEKELKLSPCLLSTASLSVPTFLDTVLDCVGSVFLEPPWVSLLCGGCTKLATSLPMARESHCFHWFTTSGERTHRMMKMNAPWNALREMKRIEKVYLTGSLWIDCVAGNPIPQPSPRRRDSVVAITNCCLHLLLSSLTDFTCSCLIALRKNEMMMTT